MRKKTYGKKRKIKQKKGGNRKKERIKHSFKTKFYVKVPPKQKIMNQLGT